MGINRVSTNLSTTPRNLLSQARLHPVDTPRYCPLHKKKNKCKKVLHYLLNRYIIRMVIGEARE